jgi:uncharacterized protein YyaL (SSP411 family)
MPNANAIMIENFVKLFFLTGDIKYFELNKNIIQDYTSRINKEYFGICSFLNSLDFFNNYQSIIIAGKNPINNREIYDQLIDHYMPNTIIIMINNKDGIFSDNKFISQINIEDESLIYLCKDNTCSLPTKNINDIVNKI